MTSQNWQDRSVSLSRLAALAAPVGHNIGAFEFLHQAGVVPHEVKTAPPTHVRFGYGTESVPAGYLASAAYEWDQWGESHPEDFIEAISAELNPRSRSFISTILSSLGRAVSEHSVV